MKTILMFFFKKLLIEKTEFLRDPFFVLISSVMTTTEYNKPDSISFALPYASNYPAVRVRTAGVQAGTIITFLCPEEGKGSELWKDMQGNKRICLLASSF